MKSFWNAYKKMLPLILEKSGMISSAEITVAEFIQNLTLNKIIKKEIDEIIIHIKAQDHQNKAFIAALENLKGCIIIPTSGGKTIVLEMLVLAAILRIVLDKNNDSWKDCDGIPVITVLSPRIMLNRQLLRELYNIFKEFSHFIVCDSGPVKQKIGINDPIREIKNTTISEELRAEFLKCKSQNLPLIIVGTYDSAETIQNAGLNIHMLICDEAHHLVSEGFTWITRDSLQNADNKGRFFYAKRKYFFTATRKITDSITGIGMQNEILFGSTIYSVSPAELIWTGNMLGAKLQTIVGEIDVPSNSARAIFAGYEKHQEQLTLHWRGMDPKFKPQKTLGAKMIVKMNDTQSIEDALRSDATREFVQRNPSVKIFFITSRDGAATKNDNEIYFSYDTHTKKQREVFLEELNNLKDEDQALIFHIRILREGIDVSGITGIYFTSWTDIIDFLQNFGRAVRLHPTDRKNIQEGIINPREYNKMIKPCGWIILPRLNISDRDLEEGTKEILRELKNNWGYIPDQLTNIISYTPNPSPDDEPIPMSEPNRRRKPTNDPHQNFVDEIWMAIEGQEEKERIINYFSSYDNAKKTIYGKVRSIHEYERLVLDQQLPLGFPENPPLYYNSHWISWGDFLGIKELSKEEIYEMIIENELTDPLKFYEFQKSGKLPEEFPYIPSFMKEMENNAKNLKK